MDIRSHEQTHMHKTDLGTDTVIIMPLSSVGLAGPSPSDISGAELEFDLFLQIGREYDFLTSRGMRDCTTGSGMSTHVSSKCTRPPPGLLKTPSSTATWVSEGIVKVAVEDVMVVVEEAEDPRASDQGLLGACSGHENKSVTAARS